MTGKTVDVTGSSLVVEDRNTSGFEVNELNQIVRNAITVGGGSPTNWDYTYSLNGCMLTKSDGTDTYSFVWDDDNRLTEVKLNSVTQVKYQYDSIGRMLTRTPYSGGVAQTGTSYVWDGWDCVKEITGTIGTAGCTVFRWYCPQGELHSFERTTGEGHGSQASAFYQVHQDVLSSIRAVTDSTGAVVGSYSYGAWGEILSASEPSGFTLPWKFVGGLGVRHDPTTGLYYMRNRWYDAGLGSFLSRDPLGSRAESSLNKFILAVERSRP